MSNYNTLNTGTTLNTGINTLYYNGGIASSSTVTLNIDNLYDNPINTVEKDNKKIFQYELIGLNKNHITVKKDFVNKTKTLYITVEGKYEDEVTGWKNNINIKLGVDYNIYNKVSWNIKDGILNIILHEIKNDEPEVVLSEE
jgi:hypothetical protein